MAANTESYRLLSKQEIESMRQEIEQDHKWWDELEMEEQQAKAQAQVQTDVATSQDSPSIPCGLVPLDSYLKANRKTSLQNIKNK